MNEHTQESTRILTDFYISVLSQGDLCSQCVHTQLDRVHFIRYIYIDFELVQLCDQLLRQGEDQHSTTALDGYTVVP